MPFQIRKLADKGSGERVARFDPETGRKRLWNPTTNQYENWPMAGVEFVGDAPTWTRVPMKIVSQAVAEGWAVRVNDSAVVRPAGPDQGTYESTATGTPHVFIHCDEIHFFMVDGTYRYKVVHQPDKYAGDGDDETKVTRDIYAAGNTRVDWFYDLKLIVDEPQADDSEAAVL